MHNNHTFIADLVAFVEKQDLPPALCSFVKSARWKENINVERDTRLAIFRIRETVDSYHTIIVNENINIEQIEDRIYKDLLGVVKLSEETRDRLSRLLDGFHQGEFAYFLNYKINQEKCPYRH